MKLLLTALWLLLATYASQSPAETELTSNDFSDWLTSSFHSVPSLSPGQKARAVETEYVFFPGFDHERLRDYFQAQREELAALGVPPQQIHYLEPSSTLSETENGAYLDQAVKKISEAAPGRKLVLIGHSRGAVDAMLLALNDPRFIDERVSKIFLLQGAFGGSRLADLLQGMGHPIDSSLPLHLRLIARHVQRKARKRYQQVPAALVELTERYAKERQARIEARLPEALPWLQDRIFYIRSHVEPRLGGLKDWISGTYLDTYYGPNDHRLQLDEQLVPGLGQPLVTLKNVGHNDLVVDDRSLSRAPAQLRRALARAIFIAAGTDVIARPGSGETTLELVRKPCFGLRHL